ncbi:hypothetical protein JX580_04990 [Thiomicrospira microaerophila]|uniref:hypothetical protein n=1 Tax=Thiomicrospira microaerophila TaxID=406020 RepID=UPI00200C9432|nr:hypothetical protein [Thiomicrospira microaerophila]UQB43234.1 hypothetical protein JX580_04990 [Thiomicrospira microaerophila]
MDKLQAITSPLVGNSHTSKQHAPDSFTAIRSTQPHQRQTVYRPNLSGMIWLAELIG